MNSRTTDWLKQTNNFWFSVYAIVAAFGTYTCMYAVRKPFTAVGYNEIEPLFGIQYKTILIISQVIGYTLSKYAGIKIISEMKSSGRTKSIIMLIAFASLMLFFFAITPSPYNVIFLFLNGLPLGLIWGLVFSFLEGRKTTELLGAGLSISFVVSSGFVKSAGKQMMDFGTPLFWMPFVTAAVFFIPLLLFTWMLQQIPPPSAEDEDARTKRTAMTGTERWNFFKNFAPGMVMLILIYMLLTAFRDFRDNFMADILLEAGVEKTSSFATIESWVAVVLLAVIAATMLIKNNMVAFVFNHVLIITGFAIVGLGTWMFQESMITPSMWMIMTGIGGYMGYIPFNCFLFERLIATFRYTSNAGFLIYLADAFGYSAAIGVMLYHDFGTTKSDWINFFIASSWNMTAIGIILTVCSMIYFINKKNKTSSASVS